MSFEFSSRSGDENDTDRGDSVPDERVPAAHSDARNDEDADSGKLDPTELRSIAAEINRDFPPVLDRTELLLLDVDPCHFQAQWEVKAGDFEHAREAFGSGAKVVHLVVRLCRVLQNGSTEPVSVARSDAQQYRLRGTAVFAVENDAADFEAELGLASGDGGWILLVRSNRVHQIRQVGAAESRELAAQTERSEMPEVEPALAAKGPSLEPIFPEPEISVGVAGEQPATTRVRLRTTSLTVLGTFRETGGGTAVEAEAVRLEMVPAGELPPPLLPSVRRSAAGAGSALTSYHRPSAAISSATLHYPVSTSPSPEAQAELRICGQARPGSVVELFGLTVKVGADGRFLVRRPLNDPRVLSLVLGSPPISQAGEPDEA